MKLFEICMFTVIILTAAQYQGNCPDVPVSSTFPCEFEVVMGNCEAPQNEVLKQDGQFVYCLKSCNLCDKVDLSKLPAKITPRDLVAEIQQGPGNYAVAEGSACSYNELVHKIEANFTSAVAALSAEDFENRSLQQDAVVTAAIATTEAVATAVAEAMSSVSIRGVTNSPNSVALGKVSALAESIANATASAYSAAVAEAEAEFTELEAYILVNDVQKALTSAAVDFSISGVTEVEGRVDAYSIAVAEALANATASAFAKITQFESSAIAQATVQAFNSSQLNCLSFCNQAPPMIEDKTCAAYVENDECGAIIGFCECACGTCLIGSEASISSMTNIISTDNTTQVVDALGEAFSQGAKGADAVAAAFVEAVATGKAEAVSSAIAHAIGAHEISSTAIAEAVTQAINQGGDEVVVAVADAFAAAERGGNAESLAEAIAAALTMEDAEEDEQALAMTNALATAIVDGGCEAVAIALTEAQAIAEGIGNGPAFATALSVSDVISSCLYGDTEYQDVAEAVTEVESVAQGNAMSTAEALATSLKNNEIRASVDSIAKAVSEGDSQAIATGMGLALSEGAPTEVVVEAIAVAINEGTEETVIAVADAFAQAEDSYADALANVLSVGLLQGGENAGAIAAAVSTAISQDGCTAVANSLSSAYADAEAQGKGLVIANLLPEAVEQCVGLNVALADSVASAVVNGDNDAVLVLAAEAFEGGEMDAFVKGLEAAKSQGSDCNTISTLLSAALNIEGSNGLNQAVQQTESIAKCIGQGVQECAGLVAKDCCTDSHPAQCRCSSFSCRAHRNEDMSIPQLGLYVYNDIGNRKCKCRVVNTVVA
eukprot:TRINITY_DN281_c0_g1_i2.p1 TRINITY_DN281_c0_g1~~TRINITY_DN281_c0_g1_i2.p1  ORF type:complete len:833 (-),score=176.45 TRINITY_DN281_c0_g1_i2:441-2939(-)